MIIALILLHKLQEAIHRKHIRMLTRYVKLLHDNTAEKTLQETKRMGWEIEHPSYRLVLAPCDLICLGISRNFMKTIFV